MKCEEQNLISFPAGNIAIGKPTLQSSESSHGESKRAVDGNKDPIYESNSCTATQAEKLPWWRVDLEKEEEVRIVSITNRQEIAYRLKHVKIYVGNVDKGPKDNKL